MMFVLELFLYNLVVVFCGFIVIVITSLFEFPHNLVFTCPLRMLVLRGCVHFGPRVGEIQGRHTRYGRYGEYRTTFSSVKQFLLYFMRLFVYSTEFLACISSFGLILLTLSESQFNFTWISVFIVVMASFHRTTFRKGVVLTKMASPTKMALPFKKMVSLL